MGRLSVDRGKRFEYSVSQKMTTAFREEGLTFKRVPLSGAIGKRFKSLKGDIRCETKGRLGAYIETKKNEGLFIASLKHPTGNLKINSYIDTLTLRNKKRPWVLILGLSNNKKERKCYSYAITSKGRFEDIKVGEWHEYGYKPNHSDGFVWIPFENLIREEGAWKYFLENE